MVSQILTAVLIALGAFAAITILVATARAVHKWPPIGLASIFSFALIAWELPAPSLGSVAGGQIKPQDILAIVLVIATVLNRKQLRIKTERFHLILLLSIAALAISVTIGMFTFGNSAYNEARAIIWLTVAAAWLVSVDWSKHKASLDLAILFGGLLLLAVLAYHAARYGFGEADSFVRFDDGESRTNRPLVSGQAMLLACAGLYWATKDGRNTGWRSFVIGGVMMAGAIACQHRSVWIALIAAGVCYCASLRGRALKIAVASAFYGLVAVLVVHATTPLVTDLIKSFSYSASNTGTLTAREGSLGILVAQSIERGPAVVLFGQPFGSGWTHILEGQLITFGPHNWYLMLYLRIGLIGLLFLISVIAISFYLLVRARRSSWAFVLLALIVYSFFYATEWYLALPLGIALSFAFTDSKTNEKELSRDEHPRQDRRAGVSI